MWGCRYHVKICTKIISMTCLTKIIISYYLHTVLLEVKDGKIRAFKKKRKQSRGDK